MDILEFINKIKGYRDEEAQANKEYEELADYARGISLSGEIVDKIRYIAMDETGHHHYFSMLYDRLSVATAHLRESESYEEYRQRMEYAFGHIQPSQYTSGGSFPQVYGDWVNLAFDIKEKDTNIETWVKVHECLDSIAFDGPDVDDAKRWLVRKAGELGITQL